MTSFPSILFLVNPASGSGRGRALLALFKSYAEKNTAESRAEALDFSKLDAQLERARSVRLIILAGGDGTISAVASRLGGSSAALGIVPLGTGNDFARELGIPRALAASSVEALVEYFRSAVTRNISVFALEYGEGFNQQIPFMNYASFGFEAAVVNRFSSWRNSALGRALQSVWGNRLGYVLSALPRICSGLEAPGGIVVSSEAVQDRVTSCSSLLFTNIRSFLGLGISNATSDAADNRVECLVVPSVLSYLSIVSKLRFPLWKPRLLGSAPEWRITGLPPGALLQVDGEPAAIPHHGNLRIRLLHTIHVMVPRSP